MSEILYLYRSPIQSYTTWYTPHEWQPVSSSLNWITPQRVLSIDWNMIPADLEIWCRLLCIVPWLGVIPSASPPPAHIFLRSTSIGDHFQLVLGYTACSFEVGSLQHPPWNGVSTIDVSLTQKNGDWQKFTFSYDLIEFVADTFPSVHPKETAERPATRYISYRPSREIAN